MTATSRFAWFTLLACLAIPALADNNDYVYIRSNVNQPWGQGTNESAMDTVFGTDNWSLLFYETVPGNSLFSSSTKFIFMEGGDSSYAAFESYMQINGDAAYTWLRNGGRMLIMAAPNDPLSGANLYLPDNIVLHSDAYYASAASSAYAIDVSNPIFSSPSPTAYVFSGDFYSHGYSTGDNVVSMMKSNLNQIVLGRDVIGAGIMVFGGQTTDNFHLPQPAAHNLLENIIYYTAATNLN